MKIKVIIENGVVVCILKERDAPQVDVEIVDINKNDEDYNKFVAYQNNLMEDPTLVDCDFTLHISTRSNKMRHEYTDEENMQLRLTEIEAILENQLYADESEEADLMAEMLSIDTKLAEMVKLQKK